MPISWKGPSLGFERLAFAGGKSCLFWKPKKVMHVAMKVWQLAAANACQERSLS